MAAPTTVTYQYDNAGQLTAVLSSDGKVTTSSYDLNGNRLTHTVNGTTMTAEYDAQDRLLRWDTTTQTATYAYNLDGELLTRTKGGTTTTYAYDLAGNLKSVVGGLPTDVASIAYKSDPMGRRIERCKTFTNNTTEVRRYLYAGGSAPVAELDGNNAVRAYFIYATRDHVPDYMVIPSVTGLLYPGTYRLVTDHLGSVRQVVKVSDGKVVQSLKWDAWGNLISRVNHASYPNFSQPFGWAGSLWDADTTLHHLGAREYDPETARWTTQDSAGFGGGSNFYVYCGNDPVNAIDPLGLGADSNYAFGYKWGRAGYPTKWLVRSIAEYHEAAAAFYDFTNDPYQGTTFWGVYVRRQCWGFSEFAVLPIRLWGMGKQVGELAKSKEALTFQQMIEKVLLENPFLVYFRGNFTTETRIKMKKPYWKKYNREDINDIMRGYKEGHTQFEESPEGKTIIQMINDGYFAA